MTPVEDGFLNKVQAEDVDRTMRKLLTPLSYYDSELDMVLTLPPGKHSDGSSIPRFIPILYARLKDNNEPEAWFHDVGYEEGKLPGVSWETLPPDLQEKYEDFRHYLDALFHRMALSTGVKPSKARAEYLGLRLGGWIAYNRYRKQEAK